MVKAKIQPVLNTLEKKHCSTSNTTHLYWVGKISDGWKWSSVDHSQLMWRKYTNISVRNAVYLLQVLPWLSSTAEFWLSRLMQGKQTNIILKTWIIQHISSSSLSVPVAYTSDARQSRCLLCNPGSPHSRRSRFRHHVPPTSTQSERPLVTKRGNLWARNVR